MEFITLKDPETDLSYSFSVDAADLQRSMEDDDFAKALLRYAKINYTGVKEGEGNLPESSGSDLPVRDKRVWSEEETRLIIRCVEARYDELNHPQKRKKIWENVAKDMVSNGVVITAQACTQKWKNLLRTYKITKDKIKIAGRCPSRFLYFKQMDEFLGTKHNISSPHTIDSDILEVQVETAAEESARSENDGKIEAENDPLGENEAEHVADNVQVSKRKNARTEYFKAKTRYLAAKRSEMQAKRLQRQEYIMKKLKLEERKTKAIEQLVLLRRREAVASSSKHNV